MRALPLLFGATLSLLLACNSPSAAPAKGSPLSSASSPPVASGKATSPVGAAFRTVVLGPSGGLFEGHLSSYLLAATNADSFVSLDAGSMLEGLTIAKQHGAFEGLGPPAGTASTIEGWILRERIKAVLISHPHLDHMAGLVLSSPEDGPKLLGGLDPTIDALRDHMFNNVIWANFADEGVEPRLKRYHYLRLREGVPSPLEGTGLSVEAWPLRHAGGISTAFLVSTPVASILYLGDTGPDAVESSTRLASLWDRVAPLVREKSLRAIFLEVSFPDGRPDRLLFGHLTPTHLMTELTSLASKANPASAPSSLSLQGLSVVITHIKPTLDGTDPVATIQREIQEKNHLGFKAIVPIQGETLWF